jgi:hypothetical protein
MSHRLTKADIQALRKSDYGVCFYHRAGTRDEGLIRASSRRKDGSSDDEREHRIELTSRIKSYEHHYHDEPAAEDELDAFHMIHSPTWSESWQTIAGLLRVGDSIVIHWIRGNNTDYLRGVGLSADELRLHVSRGPKRGFTFLVAYSVCPPNTARMTRSTWERLGYTPEQIADVRALRALGSQGE